MPDEALLAAGLEAAGQQPLLLSPPRDWPACFATPALKAFVAAELGGRKVRLCELPAAAEAERVARLQLGADSRENALKIRRALGWEVVGGFALYERADAGCCDEEAAAAAAGSSARYVGRPRWWNVTSKGLWIDLTPRPEPTLVLVESQKTVVPAPDAAELERLREPVGLTGELPVRVVHRGHEVRMLLKEKHLGRTLNEAVVLPYLKAYNQRFPRVEDQLDVHVIERVLLAGEEVPSLSVACSSVLTSTEGEAKVQTVELVCYAEGSAEWRLLKKIGMNVPQLLEEEEYAWSHKALDADDIVAFASIAKARGPLPRLKSLYLYSNYLGDEGLAALAPLLSLMPNLRELFLHANEIGSRGVRALCESPPMCELIQLTLWRNLIGDEGIKALIGAIDEGRLRMKTLVIHQNKCSPTWLEKLKAACADAQGSRH